MLSVFVSIPLSVLSVSVFVWLCVGLYISPTVGLHVSLHGSLFVCQGVINQ